ncbi:MAG: 3-dehydroquinate synthase [Bdellovibrionota bacterium]|jgi:3-dehydroquinate synthase
MEVLKVNLAADVAKEYPIFIGNEILEEALQELPLASYTKIAIVQDENIKRSLLPLLQKLSPEKELLQITIPSGEGAKSIQTAEVIWRKLLDAAFDRHALVINYGGGMTCDSGGFAASCYMRGIDFLHIPTTLLADVDAAIGGKVGLNFGEVKNIIGAFQQPQGVIIDVAELRSLPKREFLSGFAEIIKHGLIRDKTYFETLCRENYAENTDLLRLVPVIKRSCEIKAEVVAADEKEGGLRKILNFGHTFGHAVEMESYFAKSPLLHGEAVSIGMSFAAELSVITQSFPRSDQARLNTLLQGYHLPLKIPFKTTPERLLDIMRGDKKSSGGELHWTLLRQVGECVYDVEVDETLLRQVITHFMA